MPGVILLSAMVLIDTVTEHWLWPSVAIALWASCARLNGSPAFLSALGLERSAKRASFALLAKAARPRVDRKNYGRRVSVKKT